MQLDHTQILNNLQISLTCKKKKICARLTYHGVGALDLQFLYGIHIILYEILKSTEPRNKYFTLIFSEYM
jgi:hypothetical protein